jgi:hypothetical protein
VNEAQATQHPGRSTGSSLHALGELEQELICGDPGLLSGIPVMHTIHDPKKTVMNPHNRAGITEYIIHYINRSQSLTWPLGRI